MARGPKKHLKLLNAPKAWMLSKMAGIFAPRPSTGPHKLRESIPLTLILRNRLRYALTRREVIMICMRRLVKVDGKVRTDKNYPVGLMDIVHLPTSDEIYRILYDVKGRFILHRITKEEAGFKLCKVTQVSTANKATIGKNPFLNGKSSAIPYIVTHDGRTIRYPDPFIKVNDTVKVDLATGKIVGHLKMENNVLLMVSKGANAGRIGVLTATEHHPGSFEIVHLKDKKDVDFATRLTNVICIGEANRPWISLPRGKGIKIDVIEETKLRQTVPHGANTKKSQ